MKRYLFPQYRLILFHRIKIPGIFLFYFAFFFLCIAESFGQFEEKDFIKYTVKEGLSDNNVNCIEQDERDFIWIGTDFGLNRYDGFQFEKYFQGSPEGFLTSSFIHKLGRFSNHRLAVLTRNGFQVLNTDDYSIRQYVIPDSTSFIVRLNYYRDALEFEDGTIGVTTATGFYVFDTDATIIYRHDVFGKED